MKPTFKHLIFTRFCYAAFNHHRATKNSVIKDPMDPEYLEFRTRLFEIFCAPSISSQTNQNFTWIIIIDERLSAFQKNRMQLAIAQHVDIRWHVYDPAETNLGLRWLEKYLAKDVDYLMTTNHDDDDCMPIDFIDKTQGMWQRQDTLLPIQILGSKQVTQWDMMFSKSAPFGYLSRKWHRWSIPFSSCGFTLAAAYHEIPINVLELKHSRAFEYMSFEKPPSDAQAAAYRNKINPLIDQGILEIDQNDSEPYFIDVSREAGPVLMANHPKNVQLTRLYERKKMEEKLTNFEALSDYKINVTLVKKYSSSFERRTQNMLYGQYRRWRQKVLDGLRAIGIK